jgi:hypothetical protein
MANQVTPLSMLKLQLHDWKVLLSQLEKNTDTPTADIAFCKGKIQQIEQEVKDLTLE